MQAMHGAWEGSRPRTSTAPFLLGYLCGEMRQAASCSLLAALVSACPRARPGRPNGDCSDVRALINPAGRVAAISAHASAFGLEQEA
jgi:hypothetical protein